MSRVAAGTRKNTGMLGSVGSTAIVKVGVMGVSGILGLITTRLIIQHFGTDDYAQYGLLTSLPSLLPFADLGMAAVVINAVAGSNDPKQDQLVRRSIMTALRILIVAGLILILVSGLITWFDWWPVLLGAGVQGDEGNLAAFLCLAVFGLALPFSVGARVLVGLKRASTQVAAQSVVSPLILLSVGLAVTLSLPVGGYLAVISAVASGIASLFCLILAARALRPQISRAIRDVPRIRSVKGVPALGLAWPMLAQMVALPIAMQTDRILLSHLTRGDELAQYNLAMQLFGLVLQTIAAAGVALWPFFAKARADGAIVSPMKSVMWFLGGGLAVAGALAVVSPWITGFVSAGKIQLDVWLLVGFVVFVAMQSAKYPLGMYMTDARGLRFQVLPIVIMVPLNLGLSWLLIGVLGAAGPIIGSAIAVALCQVVPNFWYVTRDLRARRVLSPDPKE